MSDLQGVHVMSAWGDGDVASQYAPGDIVWIPPDSDAIARDVTPGLNRVLSVFSIAEEPEFYYRVEHVSIHYRNGYRISRDDMPCSGRLHVVPGHCDYTADWTLLFSAEERS